MEKFYQRLAIIIVCSFISFSLGLLGGDIARTGYLSSGTTNIVGDLSQLLIAGSLLWVIFQYNHQKNQEAKASVADQIELFRTEIIPLFEASSQSILALPELKGKLPLPIKEIDEFTFSWILENRLEEFNEQNQALMLLETKEGIFSRKNMINMFNAMEELAIRMELNNTVDHPALLSIRKGFVENVECYARAFLIPAPYDKNMYAGVKRIYKFWYKTIDRTPSEQIKKMFLVEVEEAKKRRALKGVV